MDRLTRMLSQAAVGVTPTYIEDVFSTYLYTGNGTSLTINNGIDLAGKGGLLWIKGRYSGSNVDPPYNTSDHYLVHSVSGATPTYPLSSNLSNGSISYWGTFSSGGGSFNNNGFTLNTTATTNSAQNYTSWTFRKAPKFFDVVTYTGNGSGANFVSHSLQSVPGFIVIKRTNSSGAWLVAAGDSGGNYTNLYLNTAGAVQNSIQKSVIADSTSFNAGYIGSNWDGGFNIFGATYVAYLFAHDAGGFGASGTDNVISCGSFTTDGSGNATVTLGWEPQWVLVKNVTSTDSWKMLDNMRGWVNAGTDALLYPNLTNAEALNQQGNPTATGFTAVFDASCTHIYIAIRRGPMRTPTTGASVFSAATYFGDSVADRVISYGVTPDSVWSATRNVGDSPRIANRLTGPNNNTTAYADNGGNGGETSAPVYWDVMNGLKVPTTGPYNYNPGTARSYVHWAFKRAPGFFDVVCYTGDGNLTKTISHNLGVVPELIIVKNRQIAYPWAVYVSGFSNTQYLLLNTSDAKATYFQQSWNTPFTATTFGTGYNPNTNSTNTGHVAYLFASCPGVSKVGSYTGNGSSQTINCGFGANGTRFVLIKRTDAGGSWYVWDSARGIIAANDPFLLLESAGTVEDANYDSVDPDNTGFIVNQVAATNINVTSATYIFLAIA